MNMTRLVRSLAPVFACVLSVDALAALKLDGIFTDHMVLQREKPVRISGTTETNRTVTVTLGSESVTATVGADGRWVAELSPRKAGGPFEIAVANDAGDKAALKDVLFGDVWVCSGQSNMEFHMWNEKALHYCLPKGKEIVAGVHDRKLRFFRSEYRSLYPKTTVYDFEKGETWHVADGDAALEKFSAVGYYFASELRKALKGDVPVGIVEAAVGGTFISSWQPVEEFLKHADEPRLEIGFSQLKAFLSRRPVDCVGGTDKEGWDAPNYREELLAFADAFENQNPEMKAVALANWAKSDLDESDWKKGPPCELKGPLSAGIVWNRFHFNLPESWVGQDLSFHFDTVKDADETFLDGVKIGSYGLKDNIRGGEGVIREYPCRIKKGGKHVIALRNFCYLPPCGLGAGIYFRNVKTGEKISYLGPDWLEKIECVADFDACDRFPIPRKVWEANSGSTGSLFAGMVAPVTMMNVKGVIWYQGCANYNYWKTYDLDQRILVDGWRNRFRDPAMPFVITQLAGFNEPWHQDPDGFAPIREVQRDMLNYPNVGVACAIDIGEMSDIHPKNKAEVGRRLAREARRLAYGEKDCLPGPAIDTVKPEGAALRLTVKNAGKGLYVKDGTIPDGLFVVADAKGDYFPAKATLEKDGTFRVSSDKVASPKRVRYAFASWCGFPPIYRRGDDVPLFPYSSEFAK